MGASGYTPVDPATGEPARFTGCSPLPGNLLPEDCMHGFPFEDEDGKPPGSVNGPAP